MSFSVIKAVQGQYAESASSVICDKHGAFTVRYFFDAAGAQIGHIGVCRECRDREKADAKQAEFRETFLRANVPDEFKQATFGNFIVSRNPTAYAEVLAYSKGLQMEKPCPSIVLIGAPGTGKTHLAVSTLKRAIILGGRTLYTTSQSFVDSVRSTWRAGASETVSDAKTRASDPYLLVLDEVGANYGSDSEVVLLEELISMRHAAGKPTIVVGNVDLDRLTKALGDRAMSRLMDRGGRFVIFDKGDYRSERPA